MRDLINEEEISLNEDTPNIKDRRLKEKLQLLFKDKYSLFALFQLLVSIILFGIMVWIVMPEVIKSVTYLIELQIDEEAVIYGYNILFHSRAIFYLIMFTLQILYSLNGAYVLIRYRNERQVFKIMFRSVFYVSGILVFHYIFAIIIFLISPITDLLGLYYLCVILITAWVALGGRYVSNFLIFTGTLSNRKKIGIITLSLFGLLCFITFILEAFEEHTGMESEPHDLIFFSLEFLSCLFGLLATIYFKDPLVVQFEPEPKPNNRHRIIERDLPEGLDIINEHKFYKNTKLTRATIPSNIAEIGSGAFSNCLRLRNVYIPKSVTKIGTNAFFHTPSLSTIIYEGTIADFLNIDRAENWLLKANTNIIFCSDGPVTIND